MRTCNKCGVAKLLTDFYTEKRSPSGRRAICKRCQLFQHYGITHRVYDLLLSEQRGVCAICEQPETLVIAGKVLRAHGYVVPTEGAIT